MSQKQLILNGRSSYWGANEEKQTRLLAAGHVEVASQCPSDRHRWNGAAWVLDPTKEQVNNPILAQMAVKERASMRSIRELMRAKEFADVSVGDVTAAKNRLRALDDEIKTLRGQLAP